VPIPESGSPPRVPFAGCSEHPTAEWVTQQARQLTWKPQDEQLPIHFLIRARDAKYTATFDTVFAAENVEIIRTPYRAPRANAFAERWIRTAREAILDRVLILNATHLRRVMIEYIGYYNRARPHQGIEQRCPIPIDLSRAGGPVQCRDVLGGIVHDYYREAA
jgi:putative transposase